MHMHPPYSSLIFFSIARYPDRHLRFTKNAVLSAHFPTAPKSRLSTRAIYHEYPKVIDHLLSLYGTASFVRNLLGLLRGLEALLLSGEKGVDGSVKLVATMKEVELHHEEETNEVTSELADERTGSGSGST
jgi:hypothetical protein